MPPTSPKIEDDALRLPAKRRARLALRLLRSLDGPTGTPEAIERLWIAEAERRLREVRSGAVRTIPARAALAELRAKLRS